METYNCEMTDTFCGEANYSWVRRATIEVKKGASRLAIVRACKKALGIEGVRARYVGGDRWDIVGACQCFFIDFDA